MNLWRLGLRKSSPLRVRHPAIGQPCVLCKCAIRAGDRTGLVPAHDAEEAAMADGLICHWACIESGLSRLRQHGNADPGTTRRFLEAWAALFDRQTVAGEHFDAYTSEADFILKKWPFVRKRRITTRSPDGATARMLPQRRDIPTMAFSGD